MADVASTFSILSNDAPNVWIAREMFRLAERNLRLGKYATQYQLIQRMSKTLRVVRYKRLNLPFATLIEGTPPDAVALATENADVTVEQWGIVVLLTDVAEITTVHPALQIAIDRTALAISETLEREMAQMLLGGTQVFFNTATSRATIVGTAADRLNTATVLKATVNLRNKGAAESEGGLYNGVMAPQQEGDVLSADATFQSASNFANVRALQYGEIGIWMGVRWARSNFLPIFRGEVAPDAAAATAVKAQLAGIVAGPYTANSSVLVTTVARDITSNYERRISQQANFALGAGNSGLTIATPTSTNYVYDLYVSDAVGGAGTARLIASRQAASTTFTVTVLPAGTAAVPQAAPAAGIEVFIAFITGIDGYGRVELNGMSLQSYITPAGASFANPLAQGRKIGTKIMWKSFIVDNNFYCRLENSSAYSASLPV